MKLPAYAEDLDGEPTFRDWDHWTDADRAEWQEEYDMHCTRLRMWAAMTDGKFSLNDLS